MNTQHKHATCQWCGGRIHWDDGDPAWAAAWRHDESNLRHCDHADSLATRRVRVWYTADTHFGHAMLIEKGHRPWATVQAMNDELIYNWNSRVHPEDWVWVLGDVAFSGRLSDHLARLHGTKLLVAGNHDTCWKHNRGYTRAVDRYMAAGFTSVHITGYKMRHTLGMPGPVVNLAHLPYAGAGDHTGRERYTEHRLPDAGVPLLHGHVHDKWMIRHTRNGTPMINVGVDVWGYAPVAEATLAMLLKEQSND